MSDDKIYENELGKTIKALINLSRIEMATNSVANMVNALVLDMNKDKIDNIVKACEELLNCISEIANKYSIPSMFMMVVIGHCFVECSKLVFQRDAEFILNKLHELTGVKFDLKIDRGDTV